MKVQGYPAYVIDNDDSSHPDGMKRQRIKLRIAVIHRNLSDEQLPWALPKHGTGPANASGGVGTVNVPPKNAKVFAHFDEEDPHLVYYSSSPTTDDVHKDNELLQEDYPNTIGHVDDMGNKVAVNKKQQTITDTHLSGATFMRDKAGNMFLFAPKDLILSAGGSVKTAATGDIIAHAGGTHSLKGGQIQMNGSDQTIQPTVVGARTQPQLQDRSGQTSL